jgi:hypothetical protein
MWWFLKIFTPKNFATQFVAFLLRILLCSFFDCFFKEKHKIFRRKLVKIAQNCDHNIDPSSSDICTTIFSLRENRCHPSLKYLEPIFIKNSTSLPNLVRPQRSSSLYVMKISPHRQNPKFFGVFYVPRVTRLGEFSPNELLFSMDSFLLQK